MVVSRLHPEPLMAWRLAGAIIRRLRLKSKQLLWSSLTYDVMRVITAGLRNLFIILYNLHKICSSPILLLIITFKPCEASLKKRPLVMRKNERNICPQIINELSQRVPINDS